MTTDPLAEKYYSISPYAYCANNPVKYIDPDGKRLVDANGRLMWANGAWTKYATHDAMRIGIAMRLTETGRNAFNHLVNSPAAIQMVISPDAPVIKHSDGSETMTRGNFMPNVTYLANSNDKIFHKFNGGTITIFEGSISKEVRNPYLATGDTADLIRKLPCDFATNIEKVIGSVAIHESEHTRIDNVKQQFENDKKGTNHDVEMKPIQLQNQSLMELINQYFGL
jgi:hypothetical protein